MADNGWTVFDMGEERFSRTNHRYAIECPGGTRLVAMVEGMGEERRQRALVMAAAPELLEALQRLLVKDCPLTGNPSHETLVRHWEYEKTQGRAEADDQLFALAAIAKAGQPELPR